MNNIRAVLNQAGSTLKAVGEWVVRGYSEGDRRAQQLFPRVQDEQPRAADQPASLAGRVRAGLGHMSIHMRNVASRVAGVAFGATNVALRLVQLAFVVAGLMAMGPIALRMALAGLLIQLLSQAHSAAQQSPQRGFIAEVLSTLQRMLGAVQSFFQPASASAPAAPPAVPAVD